MDSNKDIPYGHLKEIILEQTLVQERGNILYKRILRRISIIYISIAIPIIVGIMFLIYIVSKPDSAANKAIREMDSLNVRITLQREYIEMDRKDLEETRDNVNELMRTQDSLREGIKPNR